jgi:hypothetical protein
VKYYLYERLIWAERKNISQMNKKSKQNGVMTDCITSGTEEQSYKNECRDIQHKKEYQKIYGKKYRHENIERIKYIDNLWRQKNKDYIKKYNKQWRTENKEWIKKYHRDRKKNDVNYRIVCNLRTRLNSAIVNNYKSGSAVKDLGCSVIKFKQYIESMWKLGMSWDNWSRTGWHLDHIKPLSSFNLSRKEELLKSCHYTNYQPLWAEENLQKGNKA